MDNCDIGRRAKVRRAILDKNVRIPEDAVIGSDLDADRNCGYHVTESGIVWWRAAGHRSVSPEWWSNAPALPKPWNNASWRGSRTMGTSPFYSY